MKCSWQLMLGVISSLSVFGSWCGVREAVEEPVDMVTTDQVFTAVVDGRCSFTENRHPDETIAWEGAKGGGRGLPDQ